MLVVPTRVRPDAHGGLGLFAAADLAVRTVVWEFHPEVDRIFTPETVAGFHPSFRAFLDVYAYPVFDHDADGRPVRIRGYGLNTDDARFINHGEPPSLRDVPGGPLLAARDIAAGEELTIDYRAFDLDGSIYADHPFLGGR